MKSSKCLSLVILASVLSGAGQADAQTINHTRTGYVTAIETVWKQRVIHEPVTTTSCHTSRTHSGFHGNLGDIAIGGLIGSAIGNKLSDEHGAGSLGALFGAAAAMDRASERVDVCICVHCGLNTISTNASPQILERAPVFPSTFSCSRRP